MSPARLGRLGRPDRRRPPVVVGRVDLAPRSQVYMLCPAGWRLSAEGQRQLDLVIGGAASPDGPGAAVGRRGSSCWLLVLTFDAPVVVAALKDIAAEFLERIVPPRGRSTEERTHE